MHRSKWVKNERRWSFRRVALLVTVAVLCLAMGVLIACAIYSGPREYNGSVRAPQPVAQTVPHMNRVVFQYSVIPGGVASATELQEFANGDYVVRALYSGINYPLVHEHHTKSEMKMYVSYRVGQRVFWTKGTHIIPAGEKTYTDGRLLVRARCGNLLSFTPRYPTQTIEPELSSVATTIDPSLSTSTPMLRSALLLTTPAAPRLTIIDSGGWGGGGRPCRHEDDGDSDDCKHKHHGPPPIPVPEPDTLAMLGTGLIVGYLYLQRRK